MSRKTVTIQLKEQIIGHHGPITQVVLQEPSYDDYLAIGEPFQAILLSDGQQTASELPGVVRSYIDICLVEPKNQLLLGQCGVEVGRAVKAAVLGFFHGDVSETAPSKTSHTILSGDAGKADSAPAT